MNLRTRIHASAAVAALAVVLTACGSTSGGTAASTSAPVGTSSSAAVMTTSTRSMPMTTGGMTAGGMRQTAPAGPHNQADITFAQQMTVHHQSAIAMADLVPTRSSSVEIKALAAKIKAAQTPELAEMGGWLAAWAPETDMNGMPVTKKSDSAAMGMPGMNSATSTAMPGMMSEAQMGRLTAASGAAFDKLFLQLMITHHQGAVSMAGTETASGQNPAALALAGSIASSQTAEIALMQNLLKSR